MNGPSTEAVIEGATKTVQYAIEDLTDQLRKLESEKEGLLQTIDRLTKENAELKEQVGALEGEVEMWNSHRCGS